MVLLIVLLIVALLCTILDGVLWRLGAEEEAGYCGRFAQAFLWVTIMLITKKLGWW